MTDFTSSIENRRYRMDLIHAKSLDGNPLDAPVTRDLAIYLPPDYFEATDERYTTVYFLHGYSGNNKSLTVYPTLVDHPRFAPLLSAPPILHQIDVNQLPSYEAFDTLIEGDELEPVIFVQPDGSLHKPNVFGLTRPSGDPVTKGSFYVNSPNTGNYEDYILEIVKYVDAHYRTYPDREHRLIAGASMGGYGALSVGFRHLDVFHSIAAISPGDTVPIEHRLTHQLRVPLYETVLGAQKGAKYCDALYGDILDTFDLIFSRENPLLASVKRDGSGELVSFDAQAAANWRQGSLMTLLDHTHQAAPEAMKSVKVYLSCEQDDEFGLKPVATSLHKQLDTLGVPHAFDLFDEPKAKLSPHIFGCFYKVTPAIQHLLSTR